MWTKTTEYYIGDGKTLNSEEYTEIKIESKINVDFQLFLFKLGAATDSGVMQAVGWN